MDFLKAEIERKKRLIADKNVMQPEKKYFKRSDLVAVQEKEYLKKYGTGSLAQEEEKKEVEKDKGTNSSLVKLFFFIPS